MPFLISNQSSSGTEISRLQRISSLYVGERTSVMILLERQLQLLENYYVFRNDAEIKRFLRNHPFLAQLLIDTHKHIKLHFFDSQVFLDVVVDYEAIENGISPANNTKELVVSICTALAPKEAIEALDEFYIAWWLKASTGAKGKISIGLEFV